MFPPPSTHPTSRRRDVMRKLAYVLLYYVLAVTVALFNKIVIGGGNANFPFPMLLSAASAAVQAALSLFAVGCLQKTIRRMTWRQYGTAIAPCAIASGLDIAISNASLKFVSLSFYTMVKSSAPIFVLTCALVLGLERASWRLFAVMGVIAGGTVMTVWTDDREQTVDVNGFLMVLSAAMLSGVRWALTQLIIEEQETGSVGQRRKLTSAGPLATILYLSPIAGVIMLAMSAAVEGIGGFLDYTFQSISALSSVLLLFATSGCLTFCLILVEYKVVQETSVLTFAITGILKEIILIGLSMVVFGDRLIAVNYMGIIISISGIAAYNWMRIRQKRKERFVIDHENVEGDQYKLMVIPPAEPLQSFLSANEHGSVISQSTEEDLVNALLDDKVDNLDVSAMDRVKSRLSHYLRPFAPKSSYGSLSVETLT